MHSLYCIKESERGEIVNDHSVSKKQRQIWDC